VSCADHPEEASGDPLSNASGDSAVELAARMQARRRAAEKIIALREEMERKYGVDPDFDWKAAVNCGRP